MKFTDPIQFSPDRPGVRILQHADDSARKRAAGPYYEITNEDLTRGVIAYLNEEWDRSRGVETERDTIPAPAPRADALPSYEPEPEDLDIPCCHDMSRWLEDGGAA